MACEDDRYLITEIKGADWEGTADIKAQAAVRWCAAVNATGRFGKWNYLLARNGSELVAYLNSL
ncbi:hypothetical protein [Lichenicoccus sp.]|uniref:hypothetical protein n=1 Tax=Lichenicoccus sp. TaxID=2781899 RepID=UPI003D0E41EF